MGARASPTAHQRCAAHRRAPARLCPPLPALTSARSPPQSSELTVHSRYSEATLMPCVRDMNALHKNAPANSLQAVRKKYAQEKHGAVSAIPPANL